MLRNHGKIVAWIIGWDLILDYALARQRRDRMVGYAGQPARRFRDRGGPTDMSNPPSHTIRRIVGGILDPGVASSARHGDDPQYRRC